jgi:peptide/nickel transport system permease protein
MEALVADELASTPVVRRRRRLPSIVIVVSFVLLGLVVVSAVFGSLIAPHDPSTQDLGLVYAKPSGSHLLGTDELGRDVLSRVMVGARAALIGPLVVSLGAMLIGNVIGVYAGFRGGFADTVMMRMADLAMAIPAMLVIVVVSGILGGGYWAAIALYTIIMIPGDARVARGATMAQVQRPYIEAARTLGVSNRRIMVHHIWPNISAVVIASAFLGFASALVGLGTLSFLGVGASPVAPDWGTMLSAGEASLFQNPVATLAPGAAIVVLAGSTNLIGDWIYDKISTRAAGR